jgi:hypothetical protein
MTVQTPNLLTTHARGTLVPLASPNNPRLRKTLRGHTQPFDPRPGETSDDETPTETTRIKKGRFAYSAKTYFLTFPKITQPISNESVIALLNKTFPDELKSILVTRELHADGTPHFHIYMEFKKKKQLRLHNFFDFIFNKHGNYQSVRKRKDVINYIAKTGDFSS